MGDLKDSGYQYLGILELDNILHREMKVKVTTTYLMHFKLLLKSKLNAKNFVAAFKIWVVAVVRYIVPILKWASGKIDQIDCAIHNNGFESFNEFL